jgi:hypothetical protein
MPLRQVPSEAVAGSRSIALGRPWVASVSETAVMVALAGGVCLSWPQVARALVLATKIVVYYCFSPR